MGITCVSASVAPGGKQHLLHISYDIPETAASASQPLPRDAKSGKAQAELVLAFEASTRLFQGALVRFFLLDSYILSLSRLMEFFAVCRGGEADMRAREGQDRGMRYDRLTCPGQRRGRGY